MVFWRIAGIFGVTSYLVARATQEIGIRMALGARHSDVLTMVLRIAMVPSGLGLGIMRYLRNRGGARDAIDDSLRCGVNRSGRSGSG